MAMFSLPQLVYSSLPMITVIIQIKVHPEQVDAFKALTLPNAKERVQSAGNLRFEVYQQEDKPTQFVMVEVFRSQAEIDAYYATKSYREWHAATAPMVAEMTGSDYRQLFLE
jgi:quinol monooxygenase YgiN